MSAPASRSSVAARKSSMRPPISARPSTAMGRSLAPQAPSQPNGRVSPAESVASTATTASRPPRSPSHADKKRKQDFDHEAAAEETNINVVVRCRGRNDREVRENSGVVVSTNGVHGNVVELSMGPAALSNKSYNFDKVFSPAADQGMMYDEVVVPILDEVSRNKKREG
jgi:kinesin family protein 11